MKQAKKILYITCIIIVIIGCSVVIYPYINPIRNNSGIDLSKYTKQDIRDLAVLCKIWGYLKYYHPDSSGDEIDWDTELVKIMEQIVHT